MWVSRDLKTHLLVLSSSQVCVGLGRFLLLVIPYNSLDETFLSLKRDYQRSSYSIQHRFLYELKCYTLFAKNAIILFLISMSFLTPSSNMTIHLHVPIYPCNNHNETHKIKMEIITYNNSTRSIHNSPFLFLFLSTLKKKSLNI
jgi:hypothetical protein